MIFLAARRFIWGRRPRHASHKNNFLLGSMTPCQIQDIFKWKLVRGSWHYNNVWEKTRKRNKFRNKEILFGRHMRRRNTQNRIYNTRRKVKGIDNWRFRVPSKHTSNWTWVWEGRLWEIGRPRYMPRFSDSIIERVSLNKSLCSTGVFFEKLSLLNFIDILTTKFL